MATKPIIYFWVTAMREFLSISSCRQCKFQAIRIRPTLRNPKVGCWISGIQRYGSSVLLECI